MHVLLIHQGFATPNEPGGTRHFELARGAVEQGHRFTVIASDLGYFSGRRASRAQRMSDGEIVSGIQVRRTYTHPTLHGGFAGQLVSFISFALSSFIEALRVPKIDLVMATSPPIFQAVSAWLASALRRRPLLLEIRDLWPEFIVDMGKLRNPLVIRLARWLERLLYARADHIVVNSPAYVDYLIAKGVAPGKITFLPNGVDPTAFDPSLSGNGLRKSLNIKGKFVVVYAGVMGPANNLDVVLEAAADLHGDKRIVFLLVGDGKARNQLQSQADAQRLENVLFVGAYPKGRMRDFLAVSDACVATLQNIPMFRMTYPNKVFDYMAAGRPVLLAIDGVIREVVEAAGAGLFVAPGDAKSLAEAVRYLADHPHESAAMSRRGRAYVEKHFNRADQSRQFADVLETVAARG